MNFFEQLSPMMEGAKKVTITVIRKGDLLTVGFLPEVENEKVNKGLKILSMTGTAKELDEAFFPSVSEVKTAVAGVVSNVEEIAKSLKSVEDKERGAAAAKKKESPAKKATPNPGKDEEEDGEDEKVEELKETQSQINF